MINDLYEEAQKGLALIENAIIKLLTERRDGLSNTELARLLGLESSHEGKQKNYLTYSVLGNIMEKKSIVKVKMGSSTLYKVNKK